MEDTLNSITEWLISEKTPKNIMGSQEKKQMDYQQINPSYNSRYKLLAQIIPLWTHYVKTSSLEKAVMLGERKGKSKSEWLQLWKT